MTFRAFGVTALAVALFVACGSSRHRLGGEYDDGSQGASAGAPPEGGENAGGTANGGASGRGGSGGKTQGGSDGESGAAGEATGGDGGAPPECGDGTVEPPEECDDGNGDDTDDCTSACHDAACGDGFVWSGRETCEDGNRMSGDGCSAKCRVEATLIALGGGHTCAVSAVGTAKCWGMGYAGRLGLGDSFDRGDEPGEMGERLPLLRLGQNRSVIRMAIGNMHTCALLDDGSVKCWGHNAAGQLGLGDIEAHGDDPGEMGDDLSAVNLGTGRSATAIAAGYDHTCALLDDGSVKCWGDNDVGQLGIGDTGYRGDEPGEMGDALPTVDLGSDGRATGITAGVTHTCVLLDGGSVKCWGFNDEGRLGLGDHAIRGDEPGEMGDMLPAVDLGSGRRASLLAGTGASTCALLDDDSVKCWGYGAYGALGLGDTENRGDEPGEMGDELPTVNLGAGREVRSIAGGGGVFCALLDEGEVKCWGINFAGHLGLGDTENRGDEPGEMGDELPAVNFGVGRSARAIGVAGHACALLDDGSIKCWGNNRLGQLGLGDTEHRGDEPGEMGDALPAVELGF